MKSEVKLTFALQANDCLSLWSRFAPAVTNTFHLIFCYVGSSFSYINTQLTNLRGPLKCVFVVQAS